MATAAAVPTATNNNKMNHFFKINSRQEMARDYKREKNANQQILSIIQLTLILQGDMRMNYYSYAFYKQLKKFER